MKVQVIRLSINNETQCVPLLCLSSTFMTYILSFILDKLSFEKTPLNLGSYLKHLATLIMLKGWSRTKKNYPCYYILFLLF